MERKVTSAKASGPKMEVHRISIEKMGNGFSIKKHKRPAPGASKESMMSMMGHDEEPPTVFTKHPAAHKAVQAAMTEMHPVLPPPGQDASVSGQPSEPAAGSAPMESAG